MSDLVERLDTITATVKERVEAAADEIERLQASEAALIGHNLALQESVERLERELSETQDQRSSLLATNYDLRKERDSLTVAGLGEAREQLRLAIIDQAVTEAELAEARETGGKWREAALRLGESLDLVGPHDYYAMTPEEWLSWALDSLRKAREPYE